MDEVALILVALRRPIPEQTCVKLKLTKEAFAHVLREERPAKKRRPLVST